MNNRKSLANVLLPVIHTNDEEQVLYNAEIALQNGAHGVFLNNHPSPLIKTGINTTKELIDVFVPAIKHHFPNTFVGINDLSTSPEILFSKLGDSLVDSVWVDQPHIQWMHQWDKDELIYTLQMINNRKWIYMWSVNFKYQPHHLSEKELQWLKPRLMHYLDVIITSGSWTGHAIEVEKLQMFADIFDSRYVGVASGVTPENYRYYKDYAMYFLVATWLQQKTYDTKKDFHYLDPIKIADLGGQIHAHNINTLAYDCFWKPISPELAELLNQQETININWWSKNALEKVLSNLYPSEFTLDWEKFNSIEWFRMSLKFPPHDKRKEEAKLLFGMKAKNFWNPMKWVEIVHYQWKTIHSGSAEHHDLLRKALNAKFTQNGDIKKMLIDSGKKPIVHITLSPQWILLPDSNTIPTKTFATMISDLRTLYQSDWSYL
jgi:predicted TIM-barrel enzyme/predicted NAD-dependent protein-ADP-ribosyltransferase YbiA (DUF1768 family)